MAEGFDFNGVLALCRQLWAAADEQARHRETRDELTGVAMKNWTGPHQEQFLEDLRVDLEPEESVEKALRAAADQWADAWVAAMNDRNKDLHEQAKSDAGNFAEDALSALPWVELQDEISPYTPITDPPHSPDFRPTGSIYTADPNRSSGSW